MAKVKCKACSARYDYHEHGCCPECGAYNRPPQRNRVGADGVVHRMSDADFLDNTTRRRNSQGGKVCFEREECHEEKTRYRAQAPFAASPSRKKKDSSSAERRKKLIVTVTIVILLVNFLPILLTMCSVSGVFEEIVDELFSTEIGVEKPVPIAPAQPMPDLSGAEIISPGQTFVWGDDLACVTEITANESGYMTDVALTVQTGDPVAKPSVYYLLPDGTLTVADCLEVTRISDEQYVYFFTLPDRQPGSTYYALFTGQTAGVWRMYELPLN